MTTAAFESRRPRQGGQSLVLFVLALVALLAGVALVVDGGNAFAQQRATQNAVDASAEAGATVLLRNVAAQTLTSPPADGQDVFNAVNAAAAANGIGTWTAYYTTIHGRCITSTGTADPPCNTAAGAVQVTSAGSVPTVGADANGSPQCPLPYLTPAGAVTPASTPALACGVAAFGTKSFGTYVAGAVGISQLSASGTATAVAGAQVSVCPADAPCGFLPITFPTEITACGTTNKLDFGQPGSAYAPLPEGTTLGPGNEITMPICGSGPGSVGWLAIQPEDKHGVDDLVDDITTPDNPPLFLPMWVNAQTGNTNSQNVEDAINAYDGQQVAIPLFQCTADVKVVGGQQNPAGPSPGPCDPTASWYNGGTGSNLYYYIPTLAGFVLDHAYINGDNSTVCNSAPGTPIGSPVGGNGGTGCLKGWLVSLSLPGVGAGTGYGSPTSAYTVQLIR